MGTLKVTSTLLRKSAQTLSPLFSEDLGAMHGGSCPQAKLEQPTLVWPPLLDGESLQRKRDWLLTLLSDLASLSEKLVVKGHSVVPCSLCCASVACVFVISCRTEKCGYEVIPGRNT